MRRARWKRKGTESKLAHLCKFGECGSQLFCSEICFLLRGTGGVRISFSLVHRADSHMKPRDANRTPSASFSAAARAHLWSRAALSEAESAERETGQVRFCSPMNAMPPTAGTQFFEVCLSAQPVEGHELSRKFVAAGPSFWVSWPMGGQLIPKRFSFPPLRRRLFF